MKSAHIEIPEANHFRRYVKTSQQKKDANGKRLCLVCEGPLPKRRISYCSDEYCYRNLPSWMRGLVFKRDQGKCALCPTTIEWRGGDWEMDHIVPVVEGGGLCGLDGYRTLCRPCHKHASAELAQRRARARQDAKRPLLTQDMGA